MLIHHGLIFCAREANLDFTSCSRHRRGTVPIRHPGSLQRSPTYFDNAHVRNMTEDSCFVRMLRQRTRPCMCIFPSGGRTRRGWSTRQSRVQYLWLLSHRSKRFRSRTCAQSSLLLSSLPSNHIFITHIQKTTSVRSTPLYQTRVYGRKLWHGLRARHIRHPGCTAIHRSTELNWE